MGTKKSVIIWALESKIFANNIPVFLQEVAQMPIILHILNNLKKCDLQKIVIVIEKDILEIFEECIKNDSIFLELQDLIVVEVLENKSEFFKFFADVLKKAECDELCILNANNPFIFNDFFDEAFVALNHPINKEQNVLPGVALPSCNKLDFEKFFKNQATIDTLDKVDSSKMLLDALKIKIVFLHYELIFAAFKIIVDKIQKQNASEGKSYTNMKKFICNDFLKNLIFSIVDTHTNITYIDFREKELFVVDNNENLMNAELMFQHRKRIEILEQGVQIFNQETVFFSAKTFIGSGVKIFPHVFFGKNVIVEENVEIRPYVFLENVHIKKGSVIGPFASLTDNSRVGANNKISNFSSLANTKLGSNCQIEGFSFIQNSLIEQNSIILSSTLFGTLTVHEEISAVLPNLHIGEGCFLKKCSVSSNVNIGNYSVILEGNVVENDIEESRIILANIKQKVKKRKKLEEVS